MNICEEKIFLNKMIKHAWENNTYEEESLNNSTFKDFYKKMYYYYSMDRTDEIWASQFSFCSNNLILFYESGYEVHQVMNDLHITSYEPFFNSYNEKAAKFILLVEKKLKSLLNKYNKFIHPNEWHGQFIIDYTCITKYAYDCSDIQSLSLSWKIKLCPTLQELVFHFNCSDFENYSNQITINHFIKENCFYKLGSIQLKDLRNDLLLLTSLPADILDDIDIKNYRSSQEIKMLLELSDMITI